MRFLLADDHTLIRENFRDYLARTFDGVSIVEADSHDSLVKALEGPDRVTLVICDLNMPGMRGAASVKALIKMYSDIPFVIFSGSYRTAEINEIIGDGARGFIPKTVSSDTMGSAIKLVLSGETYVPKEALSKDEPHWSENDEGTRIRAQLTRREHEVLSELIKGSSNKVIARELGIRDFTVKAHLQKIFEKLGVQNRSQAIIKAMDVGI